MGREKNLVFDPVADTWVPALQAGAVGGGSSASNQALELAALGASTDVAASGDGSIIAILKFLRTLITGTLTVNGAGGTFPVTGTFWQTTQPVSLATLPALVTGSAAIGKLAANPGVDIGTVTANAGTNLNTSTLALEAGGNLASIKAKTDNIPAQGQALAAASTPVVLTAAQITTLTPPAAIAGFALESTQLTGNTSVGIVKTNTDPFVSGGAGGYVRQDSTATIAKETGGNLASLVAKDFATSAKQDAEAVLVGAVTEAAPATDTASSGLNGRLQRIAQRLTSMIALLPAALVGGRLDTNTGAWLGSTAPTVGSKTSAASIPVVIASDQGAVAVSGTVVANPATYAGKTITYVPVNQSVAGSTTLAAADASKKHKVLGMLLTMNLAGTLKLTDGAADLLGPCDVGITGGFVAPTSVIPYTETGAVNRALTLTTSLGAARGVVVVLTEA